MLNSWRAPTRSALKSDEISLIVDFLRYYLVRATEPVFEIQNYTFRTTGRYKRKPSLKNLPESVVHKIIGCCLDGVGLGAPEIVKLQVDNLMVFPTRYWVELGNSDEERKKVLEEKKRCRSIWEPYCRMALSRAMADVRQYVLKEDQLFPRPKCSGVNGPVEESSPVEWSVPPKCAKNSKRTSIYTLQIEPQLSLILQRVLPLRTELHQTIHYRDESNDNPALTDTSCFPKYKQDIESRSDFENKKNHHCAYVKCRWRKIQEAVAFRVVAHLHSSRRTTIQGKR
ncbi:hypothetical protein Q1695_008908 [Nippostrongylus brasiliensis]|nr:hypothetical protein Q1695_008908 [Nippostrongylus brasiliensis]